MQGSWLIYHPKQSRQTGSWKSVHKDTDSSFTCDNLNISGHESEDRLINTTRLAAINTVGGDMYS